MLSFKLPIYYWNCLAARCTLISKTEPGNKEEILNQNIFGNDQIGVTKKEGRRTIKQSLFYSNWAKSGIKTINDIWDNTENNWLPSKDILVKLTNKSNWMVEWLSIKKAIPQVWKQILMNKDVIEQEYEKLYTMPTCTLQKTCCMLNGKVTGISKISSRVIYKNLIYPTEVPKAKKYWEKKFDDTLDWLVICEGLSNKIIDRKIIEFQWKCLHGAINTEKRLQKWGKSNGLCKLCVSQQELIEHIMYQCSSTCDIWKKNPNLWSKNV